MENIRPLLIKNTINLASILFKSKRYNKLGNRVNLGCGMHCNEGWVNIDGSLSALLGSRKIKWLNKILYRLAGSSDYYDFAHFNDVITRKKIYFYNLKDGIPFDDESVDVIYNSHFLEHLNKTDGDKFIRECFRVLKKDGLMRLIVPDLDRAFELYKNGECDRMLSLFFYTSDKYDFSAHKYNYNFQTIHNRLHNVGFSNITKLSYRNGRCPDVEYLDVYPEHSLYVECQKL